MNIVGDTYTGAHHSATIRACKVLPKNHIRPCCYTGDIDLTVNINPLPHRLVSMRVKWDQFISFVPTIDLLPAVPCEENLDTRIFATLDSPFSAFKLLLHGFATSPALPPLTRHLVTLIWSFVSRSLRGYQSFLVELPSRVPCFKHVGWRWEHQKPVLRKAQSTTTIQTVLSPDKNDDGSGKPRLPTAAMGLLQKRMRRLSEDKNAPPVPESTTPNNSPALPPINPTENRSKSSDGRVVPTCSVWRDQTRASSFSSSSASSYSAYQSSVDLINSVLGNRSDSICVGNSNSNSSNARESKAGARRRSSSINSEAAIARSRRTSSITNESGRHSSMLLSNPPSSSAASSSTSPSSSSLDSDDVDEQGHLCEWRSLKEQCPKIERAFQDKNNVVVEVESRKWLISTERMTMQWHTHNMADGLSEKRRVRRVHEYYAAAKATNTPYIIHMLLRPPKVGRHLIAHVLSCVVGFCFAP